MLSPQQLFAYRGHPSSPGQRDYPGVNATSDLPTPNANLSSLSQGSDAYTRDGKPGVPRYTAPYSLNHIDPSALITSQGPAGNDTPWDSNPQAGFEPWNSQNEKLRQATIQSTQQGGWV